jgi:hypothetical protein
MNLTPREIFKAAERQAAVAFRSGIMIAAISAIGKATEQAVKKGAQVGDKIKKTKKDKDYIDVEYTIIK